MASISGFGNVGGNEVYKRASTPNRSEVDSNPQVGSDGFVASGATVPSEEKLVREQATAEPAPGPSPRNHDLPVRGGPGVPITLSMEDAGGISAIGLGSGTDKVGLGAFTNGLGSNQIVGLSGRVLAGGSPFGN